MIEHRANDATVKLRCLDHNKEHDKPGDSIFLPTTCTVIAQLPDSNTSKLKLPAIPKALDPNSAACILSSLQQETIFRSNSK